MGCGHAGIVNIMEKAEPYHPNYALMKNAEYKKTPLGDFGAWK